MRLGERHLRDGVAGVGDLYRELTSLVLERRVVVMAAALFFSARTKGALGVSTALCFPDACSDSHTSIHSVPIRPH